MTWEADYIASLKQPVQVISLEGYEQDEELDEPDTDFAPFSAIRPIETTSLEAAKRANAYRSAWSICESRINAVLGELYASTIQQIENFVANVDPMNVSSTGQAIPTGLILGANHTLTVTLTTSLSSSFQSASTSNADMDIDDDLDDKGGPGSSARRKRKNGSLLVRLSSRDCPTKKAALRSLVSGVIASGNAAAPDAHRRAGGRKPALLASDDMQMLLSWYRHKFAEHGPKIVLYLEDFEAFDPSVLSELLYIIRSIPFVLLFAIATSTNAIHSLLPRATSELLRVASFTVTQSSRTFHALMADLFIRDSQPISPGPNVFSILRDAFLDFDQSIDAVVSKLKYMYMAHFFSESASVLTVDSLGLDIEEADSSAFSPEFVANLRSLPSYQRHVQAALRGDRSTSVYEVAISSLQDDYKLLAFVESSRPAKDRYCSELGQAWLLLEILLETWDEGRAGTDILLTDYYRGKLVDRASRSCSMLRRSRDERCLAFLQTAIAIAATEPSLDHVPCRLDQSLAELENLMQNGKRQPGRNTFVNGNELGGIPQSEGDKAYTAFVARLADRLERYFRDALRPHSHLTFHELWYSDNHRILRNTFHPPILGHLRASLTSPASRIPKHLLEPNEPDGGGTDAAATPFLRADELDLCNIHKLVANAGKLVNLADWYGAFDLAGPSSSALPTRKRRGNDPDSGGEAEPVTPQKGKKSKLASKGKGAARNGHRGGEEDDDHAEDAERSKEAVFLDSVAGLAFCGLVGPSKRKVEHVSRIVF